MPTITEHDRLNLLGGGGPDDFAGGTPVEHAPISQGLAPLDVSESSYDVVSRRRRRPWAMTYRGFSRLAAAADVLIIVATACVSGAGYHFVIFGTGSDILRDFVVSVFVATFFVFTTHVRNFYDPAKLQSGSDQVQNVLLTWSATFIFFGGLVFSLGASKEASRGAILWFALTGAGGLLISRLLWRRFIRRALAAGALAGRKVVVISWNFPAATSQSIMILRRHGYRIMHQFIIDDSSPADMDGSLAHVVAFIRGSNIDEIYLLSRPDRSEGLDSVLARLRPLPVPITLIPDVATAELIRCPRRQLGDFITVELQRPPLSSSERTLKRALDILLAAFGLFALLPMFLLVALAIRFESTGPVLFKQTRYGFNGKRFKILKFRSMSVLEDGATIIQATATDSRVTNLGTVIRRTSIDELPQLLNVLRGEMSMVGPRPHAVAHDDYFLTQIENYTFRHHVKPGITGWAQINGHRGETRTLNKMQQRVEHDIWYINNWSLWLDISILLRTLTEVVRGDNAY